MQRPRLFSSAWIQARLSSGLVERADTYYFPFICPVARFSFCPQKGEKKEKHVSKKDLGIKYNVRSWEQLRRLVAFYRRNVNHSYARCSRRRCLQFLKKARVRAAHL